MAKRLFSTGLSQLDNYIGGLESGDSILWIADRPRDVHGLVHQLARYCSENAIPLVTLFAKDPSTSPLQHYSSSAQFILESRTANPKAILQSIRRFLRRVPRGACIIVDDMTWWKKPLRFDRAIVEFLGLLKRCAIEKRAIVVTSVARSAFSLQTLVQLKDLASVALDLIERDGELYFFPLVTVGRYVPQRLYPIRARLVREQQLRIVKTPAFDKELLSGVERDLFSSDSEYRRVFENAGVGLVFFERSTGFRRINRRIIDLLGFPENELRIRSPLDFVTPRSRIRVLRLLASLDARRRVSAPVALVRKSGQEVDVDLQISPVGNGWYLAVVDDLVGPGYRRQQEKILGELEEIATSYQTIVEGSNVPVGILVGNKFAYHNPALGRLLGLTSEKILQSKPFVECFTAASGRLLKQILRDHQEKGSSNGLLLEAIRSDGSVVMCEAEVSRTIYRGKEAVRLLLHDVTATKQLIGRLTESEQHYRQLVEETSEPIALVEKGTFRFANAAFRKLFGFVEERIADGLDFLSVVAEDDAIEFQHSLKRMFSEKEATHQLSAQCKRLDGSTFDGVITLTRVGSVDRRKWLVHIRDVTEQKESERALRRQIADDEAVRSFFESLPPDHQLERILHDALNYCIQSFNFSGGAVYILDDSRRTYFLSHSRGLPQVLSERLVEFSDDEGFGGLLSKTLEPHQFSTDSYPTYLPFKSLLTDARVRSFALIPLIAGDKLVGFLLLLTKNPMAQDSFSRIFSRFGRELGKFLVRAKNFRHLEHQLQARQSLLESLPATVYRRSPDGAFLYVSPRVEELTGYKPRDFARNRSLWLSIVHPDDKGKLLSFLMNVDQLPEQSVLEYRILPRGKAIYRWVRDHVALTREDDGTTLELRGILSDITLAKEVEDRLRRSEQFESGILSGIQEGVALFDERRNCIEWNEALENVSGLQKKDVLGRSAVEALSFLSKERIAELLEEVYAGHTVNKDDVGYVIPGGGHEGTVWIRGLPLKGEGNRIRGAILIFTDMTERKALEQSLRESEQILRNVVDAMGDVFILTDLMGTVIEVNREFLQLLGYSRTEAIGREFPYPWLVEEEMGRFVLWIASLREKSYLRDFDMTWKTKDGRIISMSLTTTLLRNSYGEPIAMLNLARDISDRKKLVAELEMRTKQLEVVNRIIAQASRTLDLQKLFDTVARETIRVIPFDEINLALLVDDDTQLDVYQYAGDKLEVKKTRRIPTSRTVTELAVARKKPVIIHDFHNDPATRELLSSEEGYRSQITIPFASEKKVIGSISLVSRTANAFDANHVSFLEATAKQIGTAIDRINLFRRVSEDAQYIHNLLNSIDSVVFTVDDKGHVREANKAWRSLMHRSRMRKDALKSKIPFSAAVPNEQWRTELEPVLEGMLHGKVEFFSGEFVDSSRQSERYFHVTANPMVIEGRTTGVVFTSTDITDLKRTESELKKRNDQLLVLNTISSQLATSLDISGMFNSTLAGLLEMQNAEVVLLYLTEQGGTALRLAHQFGLPPEKVASIQEIPLEGTLPGQVVSSREPVYIEQNILAHPQLAPGLRQVLAGVGGVAMAAIPLGVKDRVYGALNLIFTQPHEFEAQDRQVLALVGNQLGSAIENIRLYHELREQVDRLTTLYSLSQQLTSTLSVDAILEAVVRQVLSGLLVDAVTVHLYRESTKELFRSIHRRAGDEQSTIDTSARSIEAMEDAEDLGRVLDSASPSEVVQSADEGQRRKISRVSVPLTSNKKMLGVIVAEGGRLGEERDVQLRLLESIANLAALALEKATLHEEMVEKSREIEQRNKELDDFTYVVSHDLKEPLIAIEGYSKILLKDFRAALNRVGQSYLETISHSSTRMKSLIEDLLTLSRVGRLKEGFSEVPMRKVIEEALVDLEFLIREKNVQIVLDDDYPVVWGSDTQLQIIVRNLVSNAIKFNNAELPRVEIGYMRDRQEEHVLFVRDNGIGISPEFHDRIFVIFQRLHTRDEYEGTGAGLAIVKKIIDLHHGRVWVESEPGKGSTFFFALPRSKKEVQTV